MIITEKERKINNPAYVFRIMSDILVSEHETDRMKEHFWSIGRDVKGMVQYIELVSLGTLGAAIIHPREVFRFAIMKAVASIIVCHNHPSGNPAPSGEDTEITDRLRKAGEILGIEVQDHIIIGSDGFYSYRDSGRWRDLK